MANYQLPTPDWDTSERRGFRLQALGLQEMSIPYTRYDNNIFRFDPGSIRNDASATRIIVHANYPELVEAFLAHKRTHGSSVEKRFYGLTAEAWSWQQQVARLVAKRPLVFMNSDDYTYLRSGDSLRGTATKEWDNVGTEADLNGTLPQGQRNKVLGLDEYLSYDEIMLGSLLGVSGPSHFINDGNRFNNGLRADPATHEPRGIVVGLVGARFERRDRMDSVLIQQPVANPRQHPELTELFRTFFGMAGGGATEWRSSTAFNESAYKARIRITAEILLHEANSRAMPTGKSAYIYVVGLGLGVWSISGNQSRLYVETFIQAIDTLGAKGHLQCVRTIEFAWINVSSALLTAATIIGNKYGITVKFSSRNPAAKLIGKEAQQLLVLSYAWDGNSFPGNEYWVHSLSASGDPAAAAMSTIAELHNPIMNPGFLDRIEVLGPR